MTCLGPYITFGPLDFGPCALSMYYVKSKYFLMHVLGLCLVLGSLLKDRAEHLKSCVCSLFTHFGAVIQQEVQIMRLPWEGGQRSGRLVLLCDLG